MSKHIHVHLHDELRSGSSQKTIGKNIAAEINAGKPAKQAAAIAYSKARGDAETHVAKLKRLEAEKDRIAKMATKLREEQGGKLPVSHPIAQAFIQVQAEIRAEMLHPTDSSISGHDALNHLGEREYQTWNAWRAAAKAKGAVRFEGDKDIASAIRADGSHVGEWGGDVGSIYNDKARDNFAKALAANPREQGYRAAENGFTEQKFIQEMNAYGVRKGDSEYEQALAAFREKKRGSQDTGGPFKTKLVALMDARATIHSGTIMFRKGRDGIYWDLME